MAGVDLADAGLLVDALLAARLEFEVLHRIGDIGALAVDAGIAERPVEHASGRSDEGLAGQVLAVAGLLAHEDEVRGRQAFAEHHLGREPVEVAPRAGQRLAAQHLEPVAPHAGRRVGFAVGTRLVGARQARLLGARHDRGGAFRHGCLWSGNHRSLAMAGGADQGRDQRRLGQVLPIFDRHLALHRIDLQTRRVEDVGVIGAPVLFGRVLGRDIVARTAGAEHQGRAVPGGARFRRHDGPVHGAEPLDEEGRRQSHDVMLGFEPSEIGGSPGGAVGLRFGRCHFLEAHERRHLVTVATHRFRHMLDAEHVVVGRDVEELRLVLQPIEHAIQEGETLRVLVARDEFGQIDEAARHPQGTGRLRRLPRPRAHRRRGRARRDRPATPRRRPDARLGQRRAAVRQPS